MAKTIRQVTSAIISDLKANLNTFIASTQETGEDWFTELNIVEYAPTQKDFFTMGVYLTSPDGNVYEGNAAGAVIRLALDCVIDDTYENSSLPQNYLSAVISYLQKKSSKFRTVIPLAQVVRVDLSDGGDFCINSFAVLVEVSVSDTDYDFAM